MQGDNMFHVSVIKMNNARINWLVLAMDVDTWQLREAVILLMHEIIGCKSVNAYDRFDAVFQRLLNKRKDFQLNVSLLLSDCLHKKKMNKQIAAKNGGTSSDGNVGRIIGKNGLRIAM